MKTDIERQRKVGHDRRPGKLTGNIKEGKILTNNTGKYRKQEMGYVGEGIVDPT